MAKRPFLLLIACLLPSVTAGAQQPSPPAAPSVAEALKEAVASNTPRPCKSTDPAEVVVCGRSTGRFRIDPSVLAATRRVEAVPSKPALDASRDQSCVGPNCGGGTIPLVGMALTVLKAAELAAQGDDWREAFRTRPDAYQAYQDAKANQAKRPHVSVGFSAGSK